MALSNIYTKIKKDVSEGRKGVLLLILSQLISYFNILVDGAVVNKADTFIIIAVVRGRKVYFEMSINSTLLKYISLEKQYETIEQLIIHDNDLEHAFEIINITGSDIFNNRKTGNTDLIDYLFQKIVKHINYFLSLRDNRFDSIESIQDIFLNDYKEFILLLKFVYILPNLTGKLNNFILSLLVNYINDYKDCLFQNNNNNISISKILSLLSNNNPTDIDTNNIINPLNHKQIVVLLKLLEIIYIQNTNSQSTTITAITKNDNKVTNLIDKCILLLLSCDIVDCATVLKFDEMETRYYYSRNTFIFF